MQFGNWTVTDTNIDWNGDGGNKFSIPGSDIHLLSRDETNGAVFYEWILEATQQEWLSQNDLFDLNYAFVYAFAKSGEAFNYEVFDATLEEQFDQFDMEDNEDFEL